MDLLSLLVALIVVGVLFWACRALLAAFAVPEPIATVIFVVLVILVLFWLIGFIGGPQILRLD